jgi:hypothetical protein
LELLDPNKVSLTKEQSAGFKRSLKDGKNKVLIKNMRLILEKYRTPFLKTRHNIPDEANIGFSLDTLRAFAEDVELEPSHKLDKGKIYDLAQELTEKEVNSSKYKAEKLTAYLRRYAIAQSSKAKKAANDTSSSSTSNTNNPERNMAAPKRALSAADFNDSDTDTENEDEEVSDGIEEEEEEEEEKDEKREFESPLKKSKRVKSSSDPMVEAMARLYVGDRGRSRARTMPAFSEVKGRPVSRYASNLYASRRIQAE